MRTIFYPTAAVGHRPGSMSPSVPPPLPMPMRVTVMAVDVVVVADLKGCESGRQWTRRWSRKSGFVGSCSKSLSYERAVLKISFMPCKSNLPCAILILVLA